MPCRLRVYLLFAFLLAPGSWAFSQITQSFAEHSVLANGRWSRWAVPQTGVYMLTASQLVQAGLTLPVESQYLRVFGNGGRMLPENASDPRPDDLTEIACEVVDNGDGYFDAPDDYILFFAEGPDVWSWDSLTPGFLHTMNSYNDVSCYFLNIGDVAGKRMTLEPAIGGTPDRILTDFQDHVFYELDSINLLKSGRSWFGQKFSSTLSYHFSFDFPEVVITDTAIIRTTLAARANDSTRFVVSGWGQQVSLAMNKVDPNVNAEYVRMKTATLNVLPSADQLLLEITYIPSDQNAMGFLDDVEVVAGRKLNFTGGQMSFRNSRAAQPGISRFDVSGFNGSSRIWNVTHPADAAEVPVSVTSTGCTFNKQGGRLEEYVIFDGTGFFSPLFIETIENQDLHNHAYPDLIVVTHPDFRQQADRLADFRRTNDGLDVQVLETQMIYNEFSSGMQDPAAIRDYLRMLYLHAGTDSLSRPHYLLLFGDGSYDMKNRLSSNTNYIPTYQTLNSILPTASFVSDDFYGLLDDDEGPSAKGSIDVGVGRLPAASPDEARILVDKIMRYNSEVDLLPPASNPLPGQVSNFAAWRNQITFIADDEDANLHFDQAEKLVRLVDTLTESFNIRKIYLDAYQQEHTSQGDRYPGARQALSDQFKQGALLINFTGHGGETGLTDEHLLEMGDIHLMQNYLNLPVMVTATCEFSRYDNPAEVSAGEHLLLNENGGVSALFSTTRVAYANCNMIMNTHLLAAALEEGASLRLGDIIRIGKARCTPDVYMQNFTLLGDPSQRLTVPRYQVRVDSINGIAYEAFSDTLFAGTELTLAGSVHDESASLLIDFNGEAQAVLYDKPWHVYTLGNDPGSNPALFSDQQDVLFRGRSEVANGRFSFRFTLPADVSFREGSARLSLYAKSINQDAGGIILNLPLLNNGNSFSGNGSGPDIGMYINDRGFDEWGITGADLTFIADLEDEDGINFFGAGNGHDISMVLDDDFVNPMVLNDFYVPALGTPSRGSLAYAFSGLPEGPHRIYLRAWDVLNYSSEREINFVVKENFDVSLNHVTANPNPTNGTTRFCYDRNQTSDEQWVRLIIRSIDGRTIYENEESVVPAQGTSLCCAWEGSTTAGQAAPAGLYIYTLRLTDATGTFRQFTGTVSKVE